MRERDGGFDVLITGVGEIWYARNELAPRKAGQLEYAHRRESAWQALRPCAVLEAVVGSRAWGLAGAAAESSLSSESANAVQLERWLIDARLRWLRPG